MAMTIDGSDGLVFPDTSEMSTGKQACKAWVNFDGTGVVAIRDSFNVSSVTDNGVGDYTVNFAADLADVNYCPGGNTNSSLGAISISSGSLLVGSFSFLTKNSVFTNTDFSEVFALINGN